MNMTRRRFSSLEMVINVTYFVACVVIFIVSLIFGFMKILHTVSALNILLFIGFFFLDEVLCILIWLVGYLLTNLFFSSREEQLDKQNFSANVDIYDDDDDISDAESIYRDFMIYEEEEKVRNNIM